MRITSNILGELGAAIKRAIAGAHETSIDVPPVIQAITSLRGCLRGFQPPSNVQNDSSFLKTDSALIANGGGVAGDFCIAGPGSWEFTFYSMYSANYASGQNAGSLSVNNLASIPPIINYGTVVAAGCHQFQIIRLTVNIDIPWTFRTILAANGVGQSHLAQHTVIGNKLL